MFQLQRAVRAPVAEYLDTSVLSSDVQKLEEQLKSRVIGQDRAIHQIIKSYVPMTVGMNRPNRPLGVFLFCGPTGVGKSELVKAFARVKLGSPTALTKIDCTEYSEHHEAAKLKGAPPGYIGHGEEPRLSQKRIDQFQTKECHQNIILFDEIEKADPSLFDVILSILGDGVLTLGNSETVDFSHSFIFLTSNIGSQEVGKLLSGGGIGLKSERSKENREELDEKIYRATKNAVSKKFRPEFINRIDSMIVFRSLDRLTLEQILKIELNNLHTRIWEAPFVRSNWKPGSTDPQPPRCNLLFYLTDAAKDFIIKEGTSDQYGARELNRTIDKYLQFPLASLISSDQIGSGDKIMVDYKSGEELKFKKVGKF